MGEPLFPGKLSPRHLVQKVWELSEQGWSGPRISAELDVPEGTVNNWLYGRGNPELYDPYLDEVAISRALEGDRKVFENLTLYERAEFLTRLVTRRKQELERSKSRFGRRAIVSRLPMESFLVPLAKSLGLPSDRLRKAVADRILSHRHGAA